MEVLGFLVVTLICATGVLSQNCTFESDQCNWSQAQDDDFDWVRQRSKTGTPHTGPSGDHTIGGGGYFMYIENTFSGDPGDKARLISPALEMVADMPQCLTYWYHMHGAHIHTLNVYLGDSSLGDVLWTRQGTQGNAWLKGQLTLMVTANSTKTVVFEAIHGIIQGDIAIDDISVGEGACVPDNCNFEDDGNLCGGTQDTGDSMDWTLSSGSLGTTADYTLGTLSGSLLGSCDFENGLCSWKNLITDEIDWVENTGGTGTGGTGPATDHTYGNSTGTYFYFEASNSETGVVGSFVSAPYDANADDDICVSFWYHMYGGHIGTLKVSQLIGTQVNDLWTLSSDQGNNWINGRVGIRQDQDYQLMFTAIRGNGPGGDICVDDVSITSGYCRVAYTSFDCDFEVDTCGWTQDTADRFDFIRAKGYTASPHTGPSQDHTIGVDGYYLYIDNSADYDFGDPARLNSPSVIIEANAPKCLSFWYHMYGAHIGTLNVYLKSGNTLGSAIWRRQTTYGDQWIQAKVNIIQSTRVTRTVVIEATQGYKIHGDIAIDDVFMEDGYCKFEMDGCDFENGLCGGGNDGTADFDWTLSSAGDDNGPSLDHTYESSIGNYLLLTASSDNSGQVATFLTASLTTTKSRCLQFFYAWEGNDLGKLMVQTKTGNAMSHPVWTRSLQLGTGWNLARVSLRQQRDFNVTFSVMRGTGDTGFLAVDDIVIMDGDCPNPNECNFENGKCSWTNNVVGDNLDWVLNKRGTGTGGTGPANDHTLGTADGTYLYLEGSNASPGATAKFYSQVFPPGLTHQCLEFWYSMNGANIGTLQADILTAADPGTSTTIWTLSGNQGTDWNYGRIPFISRQEYQLIFTGMRGSGSASDLAIDDIVITDGNCLGVPAEATVHPPTVGPTSSTNPCGPGKFTCTDGTCLDDTQYCDFVSQCKDGSDETQCPTNCIFGYNNAACGWYEGTPTDKFNWHVSRGYDTQVTPDLAPRYDHTYKTLYQYYAYIAPVGSYSYPYDSAEFLSPRFSSAASSCRLNLWWYQYGLRPYYFEVWLVVDDVESKLFSQSVNMGDQWNNLIVGVGKQDKPWQIKINKLRYSSYQAATAIDDTKFEDCGWPPAASFCDSSKFWCTDTRACISKDLVCDFQDDCGDYSDEMNCNSYTQCDFQSGTCDWRQASGTDHLTWNRRMGATPTTYTGPPFDHTTGNATLGYYMYIEGYLNYYGRTAQLVSKIYRATTSRTCKFRMFYHMYGQSIGKLTVYSRIYYNTNQGQTVLWQQVGQKGPYWAKAEIALYMTRDFQIVIEATAGDYYYGDIAIDDITLTPDCRPRTTGGNLPAAPPTTPPPVPPSPTPHPSCGPTEFYCSADNRCIAAELICNFRSDCSDGEEETARCMSTSCDFENGVCGWEGVYVPSSRRRRAPAIPKFKWDRQQGKTRQIGDFRPPVDHTSNSGDGYYLFADNSPGQYRETALFKTPTIGRTGPGCHLEFYYHMGGTNVGSMQVLTVFDNDNSTRFSLSGVQGDEWKKGQVYIGSGQAFKVVIQATRGSNYQGDECIDDVKFVDCAPPVITGADCLTSEFRCANKYCIDKSKVCNFVDDCMDFTDEDHCNTLAGRCNFELDFCSWKQELTDVFDWTLFKGTTTSVGTGPDTDHTTRSEKGHYAYIETSSPRRPAHVARIASTTIKGTTSSSNCRIKLWYHMMGTDIGSLSILIRTTYDNDNFQVVKNITGDQGNFWYFLDEVLDSGGQDFKVVIEGMVGSSFRGDIAIDDVTFNDQCLAGGSIPGEDDAYIPPHDTCDDDPTKFQCDAGKTCFSGWQRCNFIKDCDDGTDESDCGTSCDFESGLCGWFNALSDSFNWTLGQNYTPSVNTGPSSDHTLGTDLGHYLYIESSLTGPKAHLRSLALQHSGYNCKLLFWYHMYGETIGTLSVYIKYADQTSEQLWSLSDNQGDQWMQATVDIGRQEEFTLVIQGEKGSSYTGDIAIDDVEFQNCEDVAYVRPCEKDKEFQCRDKHCILMDEVCDYKGDCHELSDEENCVVKPGDCHFDEQNPLCNWEQADDDDFDWVVGPSTPSNSSGPDFDHTDHMENGTISLYSQFTYVDSSVEMESKVARISTPNDALFPASKDVCVLRFWYHMYATADGMGVLRVYTKSNTANDQKILMWHKSGSQGNQWNYAKVVIGNPHEFKVVFEVIMGEKYMSDIAIDDITFTPTCLNPENGSIPIPGVCQRDQFYCPGDNLCIPNAWVNDGVVDCPTECYDEEEYRFHCERLLPVIGDKTNAGVIAGAVVGGLVAAIALIVIVAFIIVMYRQKGSSISWNFGFGNKSDDKVRMSDIDFDVPPEITSGQEAYSVDNPVYGNSVKIPTVTRMEQPPIMEVKHNPLAVA
ncbi:MAM and LDL-receptor class A domain-containing protein 1-like isoform X2 [Ptychodera flava]|uniref:MAM and LDL-receptor class A domain-containing protein 1-like isoform X2 n=1 Tax=Ptychodera flava TaxID=63121 RepID=UPI00396A249A